MPLNLANVCFSPIFWKGTNKSNAPLLAELPQPNDSTNTRKTSGHSGIAQIKEVGWLSELTYMANTDKHGRCGRYVPLAEGKSMKTTTILKAIMVSWRLVVCLESRVLNVGKHNLPANMVTTISHQTSSWEHCIWTSASVKTSVPRKTGYELDFFRWKVHGTVSMYCKIACFIWNFLPTYPLASVPSIYLNQKVCLWINLGVSVCDNQTWSWCNVEYSNHPGIIKEGCEPSRSDEAAIHGSWLLMHLFLLNTTIRV